MAVAISAVLSVGSIQTDHLPQSILLPEFGLDPRLLKNGPVCTENLIRVEAVMESPKLAE